MTEPAAAVWRPWVNEPQPDADPLAGVHTLAE
jgi:hypothetical protein